MTQGTIFGLDAKMFIKSVIIYRPINRPIII